MERRNFLLFDDDDDVDEAEYNMMSPSSHRVFPLADGRHGFGGF